MSKFRVGDKVKISKIKSIFCFEDSLENCSAIRGARNLNEGHLFVSKVNEDSTISVGWRKGLSDSKFLESDLELYEEPIVYNREYLKNNKIAVLVNTEKEHDRIVELGLSYKCNNFTKNYVYYLSGSGGFNPIKSKHELLNGPYKFVEAEEVINSLNISKIEQMKAKKFSIKGKLSLLKAIKEDLIGLGYTFNQLGSPAPTEIINNTYSSSYTKEQFTELALLNGTLKDRKIFTLPQDYQAALDFAKEQLEDKYWTPEYKVGDVVVLIKDRNFAAKIGAGAKINSLETPYFNITWIGGPVNNQNNGEYNSSDFRLATPEEIEIFNKPKFVERVIGSKNTCIRIYKDEVIIQGRNEKINIRELNSAYNILKNPYTIGDFALRLTNESSRKVLIGCEAESNYVSLNEIDFVLKTAETLK